MTQPELDRRDVMKLGIGAAAVATAGVGLPGEPALAAEPATPAGPAVGAPMSRAEGALKVAGQARYAIEQTLANMAYGVTVQSTRAAGRILNIDTTTARALPGVIDVYTPQNPLKINAPTFYGAGGGATEVFTPLQDDIVRFNGMHIALVVAETFEQATAAAALLTGRARDPRHRRCQSEAAGDRRDGGQMGRRPDRARQCRGEGRGHLYHGARI